MNYQSGAFLLFSAGVVLLYYLFGKRMQKYILLLANIVFLVISGAKHIPYIAVTLLASYFCGLCIGRIYDGEKLALKTAADKEEKKAIRAASKKKAKRWLILFLVISVGLLFTCKYLNFIAQLLNDLLRHFSSVQIPLFKLLLPLGISFYTFMAIGYVLDVYWKRYDREKNFIFFALFLTYFPHFVQGPIDRYNKFKSQIQDGVPASWHNLTYGLQLMLWGFFKKLVVADRLGIFVDSIYGNWSSYGGLIFILTTMLYAVQIYTDFSGCIDIVSGLSETMGIHLAENFHHPYFARTIPDFWRRWHISLTSWFRDYIYLPVSTSRFVKRTKAFSKNHFGRFGSKVEMQVGLNIPLLVVWFLTGLWHGAATKYIAWGLYYGILMMLSNIFAETNTKLTQKLHIKVESFGWKTWQVLRTFTLTLIGRVIFRAENYAVAKEMLKSCVSGAKWEFILDGKIFTYGLNAQNLRLAIVSILVVWIVDLLQERMKLRDALAKEPLIFRWVLIFGCLMAVIIFGIYGPGYDAAKFIYEQF